MNSVADDDREGWGGEEAVAFDIPSRAFEQGMAGGREAAEARHRGARVKAPPHPAGRPRSSRAHSSATSSSAAAAGEITRSEAF